MAVSTTRALNGDRPHYSVPEFLAIAVRVFKYSDIEEYRVQLLNGRADRWTTVYLTDDREVAEEIASSIADGLWLEKRKTVSGYTGDINH